MKPPLVGTKAPGIVPLPQGHSSPRLCDLETQGGGCWHPTGQCKCFWSVSNSGTTFQIRQARQAFAVGESMFGQVGLDKRWGPGLGKNSRRADFATNGEPGPLHSDSLTPGCTRVGILLSLTGTSSQRGPLRRTVLVTAVCPRPRTSSSCPCCILGPTQESHRA